MTRSTWLALALAAALFHPTAHADLPCDPGGEIAVSSNGRVHVTSSAHGCRGYPSATFTVSGGAREYTIADIAAFDRVFVSDTGRTVLLVEAHPRADRSEVRVYRDGRSLGAISIASLLGAEHRAVTEGRYVDVSIRGVSLVIVDVDGTELKNEYLGVFH